MIIDGSKNIKHQSKSQLVKLAFAYYFPHTCPFLNLDSRRVIDIFDDDGNGEVDFKEFIMGLSHFRSKYLHWNVQGWCDLMLVLPVQRVTWRANSVSRLGTYQTFCPRFSDSLTLKITSCQVFIILPANPIPLHLPSQKQVFILIEPLLWLSGE